MNMNSHNKLVSFIWSIADDCLRDVYVRGKYRDVILPMVVLRRLDALLLPTKDNVLEQVRFQKEDMKNTELWEKPLEQASGYVFYNTSNWTLDLIRNTASNNQRILETNFNEYLNGFSNNVQEIIENFNLKSQIEHMAKKDVLLDVLERFTSPYINLTPFEIEDPEGRKLPALTNLGMGYVFEELIRKFNEENNEEAGEHFTPREVINLMTNIIFKPIKDNLPPVITIYDPACGSGGMLTESQNFIKDEEGHIRSSSDVYLFGKEINDETYAICKSDMMIKGNDPDKIKYGNTLATNEFSEFQFDFMLTNPPYGKSWATDVKYIKNGKEIIDSRFLVKLKDYWGNEDVCDATPRTSDGQLLFLMEMIDKMKPLSKSPNGSRIASVHNGSSLFTGDAGGGESNIRRYIIENDMLECIIQLPNNLFYNTGITTYIWVLSNNKSIERKGKVLLIDASQRFTKLRKNLGQKNCELTSEHIDEILSVYMDCKDVNSIDESGISAKVFDNQDFGFYKVVIERPKRIKSQLKLDKLSDLRFDKSLQEVMTWAYGEFGDKVYKDLKSIEKNIIAWCEENGFELNAKNRKTLLSAAKWLEHKETYETALLLLDKIGEVKFDNYNKFTKLVDEILKENNIKLSNSQKNNILNAVSWSDEKADIVIKKTMKIKDKDMDLLLERLGCKISELPDYGYFPTSKKGEYIIYESDSDLRDSESIPVKENIYDYFKREVKPHINDAWINIDKTKIGYEISFNKYFYKHKPLRDIVDVSKEILALEKENEGLILDILGVL